MVQRFAYVRYVVAPSRVVDVFVVHEDRRQGVVHLDAFLGLLVSYHLQH